ncbi:MAG: glycosyltransferase family A protein, partial [Vicinamibacteria bacterium]
MDTTRARAETGRVGRAWEASANLSVLISTWNRSQSLSQTLQSISRCTIPAGLRWELVLVNNNCTDDTDKVAKAFSEFLPIVYVKEPIQGLSRAKNTGLAAASGELILFTDDDVEPCEDWIALYWTSYRATPSGYYFGGPVVSRFELRPPDPELLEVAPPEVRGFEWGS